jgi:hypothetical protein
MSLPDDTIGPINHSESFILRAVSKGSVLKCYGPNSPCSLCYLKNPATMGEKATMMDSTLMITFEYMRVLLCHSSSALPFPQMTILVELTGLYDTLDEN